MCGLQYRREENRASAVLNVQARHSGHALILSPPLHRTGLTWQLQRDHIHRLAKWRSGPGTRR